MIFAGELGIFLRVSMGNPHAIAFETGLDEAASTSLAPRCLQASSAARTSSS